MTRNLRPKHAILSIIVILIALPGMLSACSPIAETPISTEGVNYGLPPTEEDPATQELTLVPETEVATATPTWTLTPEPSPTATATATETPIPTEVSLIEGNIFFDPQLEADFDKVAKSPSPIDEPEKFAAWQDEYLKMVNEKLETFIGYTISGSYVGAEYDWANLVFKGGPKREGNNLEVVASYLFDWKDNKIITKTFALENRDGSLTPFSITYSNLPGRNEYGYTTPSEKVVIYVSYAAVVTVGKIEDPFSVDFFNSQGISTDLDTFRRFLSGLSGDKIEEDKNRFSRMPFVLWLYTDY